MERKSEIYPSISAELIKDPSKFYANPIVGIFVKTILLFPVAIEIGFLSSVGVFISIANSFVVLVKGKMWGDAYKFYIGLFRLIVKNSFFLYGFTNKYPGFTLDIQDNFKLDIEYPKTSNRFLAIPIFGGLARIILLIPFAIFTYIIQMASTLGIYLIAWAFVLFKGRYPETMFELGRDYMRLNLAIYSYLLGIKDNYPSFEISWNHKREKIILIAVAVILFIVNMASSAASNKSKKDYKNTFPERFSTSSKYYR